MSAVLPCEEQGAIRAEAAALIEREVRSALASVLCNAANYPAEVGAHIIGRDLSQLVDAATAAALAARPAPVVSGERVAELRSRIAALVNPAGDPNPAWDIAVASIVHEVLAVFPVADAPAADDRRPEPDEAAVGDGPY